MDEICVKRTFLKPIIRNCSSYIKGENDSRANFSEEFYDFVVFCSANTVERS